MTTWNYPISWSKLKAALECELQLQYLVEKRVPSDTGPNYYRNLGSLVQFTFEQYFNQGINRTEKGRRPETMVKVTEKILASKYFGALETTYPNSKNEETLKQECREQTRKGHEEMGRTGLLDKPVKSEVKWRAVFRGLRIFALMDFTYEGKEGTYVYDGKGHAKENADPRQLVYYALAIAASGKKVAGGGFYYWQHGYREVDLSPKAIKEFIDGDLSSARKVFERLRTGTDEFIANPSPQNCNWCGWKSSCPSSLYKRREIDQTQPELTEFEERRSDE